MSGLTYNVDINFRTHGDINAKLGDLNASIGRANTFGMNLSSALSSVASNVAGVVTAFGVMGAAGLTAVAGFGAALTKMNAHLEETQISLAAIFKANGTSSTFTEGMADAAGQIAKMRKDAAELPGEFTDLVNIFKTIAPNTSRAGLGQDATRHLAAQTMSMAAIMSLPMHVAAREMSALIEGRAGAHNILGLRLMGLAGDRAKDFNQKSEIDRIRILQKEFAKYDDALEGYKHSFVGLFSTFKDSAKQLGQALGKPLFDLVKRDLEWINAWWTQNGANLQTLAEKVGQKFADGLETAQRFLTASWPAFKTFFTNVYNEGKALAERLGPVLEGAFGMFTRFLENPHALKILEVMAAGGMAGKIASPLLKLGMASGGSEALMAAGVAASEFLVPAIIAAGSALFVYKNTVDAVNDSQNFYHEVAQDSARNLEANSSTLATRLVDLGDIVSDNASRFKNALLPVVEDFATWLGIATMKLMNVDARIAGEALKQGTVQVLAQTLAPAGLNGIASWLVTDRRTRMNAHGREKDSSPNPDLVALDNISKRTQDKLKPGVPSSNTHIQKVEIVVQTNQDPLRVARLTVDELNKLSRKSNPTAKQFVASR